MSDCPLCKSPQSTLIYQDKRPFYHCKGCDLIFVPKAHHLSPEQEKMRYDKHRNEGPGYEAFLLSLVTPLKTFLKPGMEGLDFGSGPAPTLARLAGYPMDCYDPHYQPILPDKQYDFVAATEVVEHFSDPLTSWNQMVSFVKPGGILAIMTLLHEGKDFPTWWYKNDATHVAFYSSKTLEWILERDAFTCLFKDERIGLFVKGNPHVRPTA